MRRPGKHLFGILLAFFLSVLPALGQAPEGGTGSCLEFSVRSTSSNLFADGFETGDTQEWGFSGFRATQVLDLEFEVLLADDLAGDHLVHFDFKTPRGHLYQTLTIPVSSAESTTAFRKVEGYPRPLPVQKLEASLREGISSLSARATLPIGGTIVVSSGLYGSWTATVRLDTSSLPCGSDLEFAIGR